MDHDLQPVLIGVAQATWRDRDPDRTPVDALQAVATQALSDTGSARVISCVDRIVHLPFLLNQVPDLAPAMPVNPGAALAHRLGIDAQCFSADVGGNLPQQLLNEFAAKLRRGEGKVVLLCGVELLASFLGALKSGKGFPAWASGREDKPTMLGDTPPMTAASELAHGLFEPVNAYPLFESALRHAKGLDPATHRALLGKLIAAMSTVAAANPYAWKNRACSAQEVLSTENGNRIISAPYTKLMNAIINVDQAAALVLTTVGQARAMGVDPARWVYLRGAANTQDSWFLSERAQLHRSPALAAAATAALEQSGFGLGELDYFDLYSCFPSAIQVACDALGLGLDDPRGVTVTGGMTLFGGPGNNYSTHAIAEMVERLRAAPGSAGLVSANGGYLTKHAVGVYAAQAPAEPWAPLDGAALQARVAPCVHPVLAEVGSGVLTICGHTVPFKGDEPHRGIVVGDLTDGRRCVAICNDAASIGRLLGEDCVGQSGAVVHRDGQNHFVF